jgi:hypothetical protein
MLVESISYSEDLSDKYLLFNESLENDSLNYQLNGLITNNLKNLGFIFDSVYDRKPNTNANYAYTF